MFVIKYVIRACSGKVPFQVLLSSFYRLKVKLRSKITTQITNFFGFDYNTLTMDKEVCGFNRFF